jgi:hypothetical protein
MRNGGKAAAALQLVASVMLNLRPVSVRVQIGRPIYASDIGSTKSRALHQAVLAEMAAMIRNPACGQGDLLA